MLLLLALACQADQKPQAIEAHDVCTSCKMAISQARYAAQVVDKDGNAYKFDDIGCLLRYLGEHNLAQHRIYVMDYESQQWLPAETAAFVKSEAVESPMASGLAAFRDHSAAQQFLKNNPGQVMKLSELLERPPEPKHHAPQQP